MGTYSLRPEAVSRGARMLRTALGPAIAGWLEDLSVVEVMLNPDGRIWIDRLTDGRGAQRRLVELAGVEGLDKRGDYRLVTKAKLASLGDPA